MHTKLKIIIAAAALALLLSLDYLAVSRTSPRYKNIIGMEMVRVPAGSFVMGSNNKEDGIPQQNVTIDSDLYVGSTEVTQAQWKAVMGDYTQGFTGDVDLPAERISPNEAQIFILKLNQKEKGRAYRLPTEAEWEYACRAKTAGDYAGKVEEIAWFGENSGLTTHPVGKKSPNAFGLFDMHGNASEWCEVRPRANNIERSTHNTKTLDQYALRGGGCYGYREECRSFSRSMYSENDRLGDSGFRVVSTLPKSRFHAIASIFWNGNKETINNNSNSNTYHDNSYTIKNHLAGNIYKNIPIKEIKMNSSTRIEITNKVVLQEGQIETRPVIKIFDNSYSPTLQVEIDCAYNRLLNNYTDKVGAINISSPTYETEKQIHCGSTIGDFIKAYPDCEIKYVYWASKMFMKTKELESIIFIIDYNSYKGNGDTMTDVLQLKDFDKKAQIKKIRII